MTEFSTEELARRHGVRNIAQAPKLWTTPDRVQEPVYCIVPVTNFNRFQTRWKHAVRTFEHLVKSGVILYVVEIAYGEREHAFDEFAPNKVSGDCHGIESTLMANCRHDDPNRGLHRYIKLRSSDDCWYKENAITIAAARLPSDWKYLMYADADIVFARPNFVSEALAQMQRYPVVQMFSQAQDLGPNYDVLSTRPSFVSTWRSGNALGSDPGYYDGKPGPRHLGSWSGLCWGWRRDAWDAVGGIPDFCLHGGGDYSLAHVLIGQAHRGMRSDLAPGYISKMLDYQALCEKHIRRKIGFVSGVVSHFHHGPKAARRYVDRHKLLAVTQFDPNRDIRRDSQGLYRLVDDGSERFLWLRDGLIEYSLQRNEDDVCVE